VIPVARLGNITKLADSEISALEERDSVIVIGGANNINKNEVSVGQALRTFCKKQTKH
jgi:hypothetical protein